MYLPQREKVKQKIKGNGVLLQLPACSLFPLHFKDIDRLFPADAEYYIGEAVQL